MTGNNHLKCITNEIQRQSCLLINKCLEKQANSQIFDNFFNMHAKPWKGDKEQQHHD